MKLLILEENEHLRSLWSSAITSSEIEVVTASNLSQAQAAVFYDKFDIIIMNVQMDRNRALMLSDMATFRNPDVSIICVSNDSFFSDGTLFDLIPNVRSVVTHAVKPQDLGAMVRHMAS